MRTQIAGFLRRLSQSIAGTPAVRNFAGAETNRFTADWLFRATNRSADGDNASLRQLKNRAREQRRNSPFGNRYSQILVENIVGPNGIGFQAKNKTKEGKLFPAANAAIEAAWDDAGAIGNWDLEGKLTRDEQIALAVANWGTDGEILLRIYRGRGFGPYGFKVQCLDTDLLREDFNQSVPLIRQGVEVDEYGAPVAYHLWSRHPQDVDGGFDRRMIRVPASDIIHAFIPLRPGQTRGVPHSHAIMFALKMLDGYIESEAIAARIESAKMGAIVDANTELPSTTPGSEGKIPTEIAPGEFFDFRGTGAKLELWDPQHPAGAFGDFNRALSHYIAMGWGLSYGTLTGDLADATYSSMKVGRQPEQDHFRRMTRFVIDHVLERVHREWLAMALVNGQIAGIQDYEAKRWLRHAWQPRGFPSPDPLKDITADLMEVAAGTKTLTEICADRGKDLEEVLETRRDELQLLEDFGVTSTLPGVTTTVVQGNEPPQNENAPPKRSLRSIA